MFYCLHDTKIISMAGLTNRAWQFGSEASGLNVRSRRSNVVERIDTARYRSNADDERGRDR